MGAYRVKILKMSSGERFPILLDGLGHPMFEPTVYALTELRARNQATNTILNALRGVMAFYLFLDVRQIELDSRLAVGHLLSLGEVEDLARLCRQPIVQLAAMREPDDGGEKSEITSLEKARMRLQSVALDEVSPAVAGARMRYIRDYIDWLAKERLARHGLDQEVKRMLVSSSQLVAEAITARVPASGGRNALRLREGLPDEEIEELLRVIDPHSVDNPWRDQHARYRNALIVLWMLHLGPRRGEVLGLRVKDINFRAGEVAIHRRADDPEDPRVNQPQAKTKPRVIPVGPGLLAQTQAYVLNFRSMFSGARKHGFLFVASGTGAPLAQSTVGKIFRVLRAKGPNLPEWLTPHVLRHTWNDRFSRQMDDRRVPEEAEKKMRAYLMGWSETSGTAATYTRRHIREKAKKVSLELQNRQFMKKGE